MISAQAEVILEFGSEMEAHAIYNAIKPETGAGPSDRAEVKLHLTGNTLLLGIQAADAASFRACVNTYSRWIGMANSLAEV